MAVEARFNPTETMPLSALRAAFTSARSRAASSGMRFQLTYQDVLDLFEEQGHRCAISGLNFGMTRIADAFVKHPFAPSIDRINCSKGYTLDNVRLVCVAVNFGLPGSLLRYRHSLGPSLRGG